ncbi:MAG TPA: SRPBCC domain-containing protein [Thermoanaerobaculia bacterium]|nr:SRPBCC domain-containing protein [Thermoanaerobaculia bacterium]
MAGEKLEVRRTYAAPPEKIFRAWTDPEEVKQWFPPEGYEAARTIIDLRPGGTYEWGLRKLPDGQPFCSTGTFIEIAAPRRLVYTWRWSGASEADETLVTVEFAKRGSGTEIVIRHERFPNADLRNQHKDGWILCLEQLSEFLKKKEEAR